MTLKYQKIIETKYTPDNVKCSLLMQMETPDSSSLSKRCQCEIISNKSDTSLPLKPEMSVPEIAFVSIIIPCYNQAHFLGEAIQSVLSQTYPHFEVLVVDDGSSDNTPHVATHYGVRCIRQTHRGLAAARNKGLYHSRGQYLVFLDADDRLLPDALDRGLACFKAFPHSAFVFGYYRMITRNGSLAPTWREQRTRNKQGLVFSGRVLVATDGCRILKQKAEQPIRCDHYASLLRCNHIAMHATVMYRRGVFDQIGWFDETLPACEDYDLYLRIARRFPIAFHEHVVAEYRWHGANMTHDAERMLTASLQVMERQREHIQGNREYEKAYGIGIHFWQDYYGRKLFLALCYHLKTFAWRRVIRTLYAGRRYGWCTIAAALQFLSSKGRQGIDNRWHRLRQPAVGRINWGQLRNVRPAGLELESIRGQSIDQYYKNRFLKDHAEDILGDILEIKGDANPGISVRMCDHNAVHERHIISFNNLGNVGGITSNSIDCIILIQALDFIYNLRDAIEMMHRILRPGGVLLATLSGSAQHHHDPVSAPRYRSFTTLSTQRLFAEFFPGISTQITVYGNALAASACLHQLPASTLSLRELEHRDPHYALVIGVKAVKQPNLCGSIRSF